jgi:hypothetical protein
MTRDEKQILLRDLCSRLSYETWVKYEGKEWLVTGYGHGRVLLLPSVFSSISGPCPLAEEVSPYLRPMSSMTEEEKKEFQACHCIYELHPDFQPMMCNLANELNMFDWLNAHHFDYRGLIHLGLAIEAPEGMYYG